MTTTSPLSATHRLLQALILLLGLLSLVNSHASGALQQLPQQSFEDIDGNTQPLDQWRGKVVVLNFWATWCPPCRREIPTFTALQREYQQQGLQFIGIAIDDPRAVSRYIREQEINYPTLLGEENGMELSMQLGNRSFVLPYSAIFDRSGRLVSTHRGELTREELKQRLSTLLVN